MDHIICLEQEIADLKNTLMSKEKELNELKKKWVPAKNINTYNLHCDSNLNTSTKIGDSLPRWAIERYSRQILLADIGVQGQERICAGSVLVVGAGGLGCPAAAYLAGAGVGEIGIVDYDTVSVTNIHRQILHYESDEHNSKVQSAADSLRKINSHIKVTPYNTQLTASNALDIISKYQVVLDCSDNVPTRYLLGDMCAKAKIPLVSGSALKMEGQLTVYGYRAFRNKNEKETRAQQWDSDRLMKHVRCLSQDPNLVGPCYRCVFRVPPPPEAVGSCSAQGVAGPVPGMIGCLQALEAIKILVGLTHEKLLVGRMLVFDGEDMTFRIVKLRPRNPECVACSDTSSVPPLTDYEAFCKTHAKEEDINLKILPPEHRISAQDLATRLGSYDHRLQTKESGIDYQRHLLVDVRSAPEFSMCRITGAVNYPLEQLYDKNLDALLEKIRECTNQVIFICRRGNDSQLAVKKVLDALDPDDQHKSKIMDLDGGLHAWSKHIDHNFPVY